MDPTPFIAAVVYPVLTVGFTAVLFVILHLAAARRGGSILNNMGRRGWVFAFQVVFAASLFSGIVGNALMIPYNFPLDWTPVLIHGPVLGALGTGVSFNAWREIVRSLPVPRNPAPQKG